MKKFALRALVLALVPVGLIVTVWLKREPTFEGKPASVWFDQMKIKQNSPALDAFKRMGAKSIPVFQRELGSQKTGHRLKAAWALGELGQTARPAVSNLIESVGDKDPMVQLLSIQSLAKIGDWPNDMIPKLTSRLGSTNVGVNVAAADLLGRIEKEKGVINLASPGGEFEYATAFAGSPVPMIRARGAHKLAGLPRDDKRVAAALESLARDTNDFVRAEVSKLPKN